MNGLRNVSNVTFIYCVHSKVPGLGSSFLLHNYVFSENLNFTPLSDFHKILISRMLIIREAVHIKVSSELHYAIN